MRIVFDFHGKPQVTGGTRAYSTTNVRQPGEWRGTQCDLLIIDCIDWENQNRREGDAIYIEGNTESVRQALQEALRVLDISDAHVKKETLKKLSEEVECPLCHYWVHPRAEWHADGFGNKCGTEKSTQALIENGINQV